MSAPNDNPSGSPFRPLLFELARMRKHNLTSAIEDVDKIIDLLTDARAIVAQAETDSPRIMAMTTLQNPVKNCLEKVNEDLKNTTKAQRGYGKALDKALPQRDLPMETDAMADQVALLNRAITMHLLREGQFSVASTFMRESREHCVPLADPWPPRSPAIDGDGDHDMIQEDGGDGNDDDDDNDDDNDDDDDDDDGDDGLEEHDGGDGDIDGEHEEDDDNEGRTDSGEGSPGDLQAKFSEMYSILSELKTRNLTSAIGWARHNHHRLEANGSTLYFELSKLQFLWLFKGPAVNGLPDDDHNGPLGAFKYGRQHLARFQARHLREIQQLSCAMVYAPNIDQSPYRHIFEIGQAFDDISLSFTREFCSLLGLSAESPLYVAATAGAIALPRLIKYTTYMKEKKTEWTTEHELAFETPLPPSMIYHPIFVCPISKEQTTEKNPPMMLPCGHVICQDSLRNITKSSRYKCPYCPMEGAAKDAIKITL